MADILDKMLPMRAGAEHARLRGLVSTAFSARSAEALRERINSEIETLLVPSRQSGQLEVVGDIAQPLPVAISCAMLAVPSCDRAQVMAWATLISTSLFLPAAGAEVGAELDRELPKLAAYIRGLCAARAGGDGNDLISVLLRAHEAGGLDEDELFAFVVMLFVNGLETLTAGLTVAAWRLLRHPEHAARLAEDRSYCVAFFDEAQRLNAPVRASGRTVVRDVQVAEHTLPAGSALMLLYAASSYDPRRFSDPERFDPDRRDRRHLAFGHGPHHCLGAPLSLLAGGELLHALAGQGLLQAASDHDDWDTSLAFGGLRRLPVRLSPSLAPLGLVS
jgi:cytochrome P450